MPSRTVRALCATALSAAALAVAAPGLAQADGTQDPAYSHPPTSTPGDDRGAAPLNEQRAPLQQCPGGAADGTYSAKPSYFPIGLGHSGPTTFTFSFDAYSIPDKFDILYEGKQVYTTGWRGSESQNNNRHQLAGGGDDSVRVTLPAGRSSTIEVRVNTDDTGTAWKFSVSCPS